MPTHDHINLPQPAEGDYSEHRPTVSPIVLEEEQIRKSVIRLSGHILGFILGVIGALVIFIATNWLVLKGGPVVGPHMRLLDQFFVGYSVTFIGSLVGAVYAFIIGYVSGLFVAMVYNWVISFRSR